MPEGSQLTDFETGEVLIARLELAATFWQRLRGLLFRPALVPGDGLLIVPCRSIHTHWMRHAIDVALLDRDGVVLSVHRQVPPWRMIHGSRVSHAVLETAGGQMPEGVQVGRRLCVTSI